MMRVAIATKKDFKEFAGLRLKANKYAARFDKDVVISDKTLVKLEELTRKEFEDPRILYLVARERYRMIGIAIASLSVGMDKSAFIGELFVEEEYRGRGVGQQLIKKVMKIAKNKGFKSVEMTVARRNKAAQALYKRLGFHSKKREYLLLHKDL